MNHRPIVPILLLAATAATVVAEEPVRIRTKGSKPMLEVCMQVADLFHWRVTYEDAPVLNRSEVVQERSPSGVPWLTMRAVPVSFEIPPMGSESLRDYRRKVMDLAMATYAGSGNRAAFRYIDDGEYIHVTPSQVAGPDGILKPFESILNIPVNVPRGRYNLGQLVSSIIAQVGNRVGTTISLGTIPNNIFAFAMVTEEANNESAREVLMRAFGEINGPRYAAGVPPMRMCWHLTYMADGPQYLLNVNGEPVEFDDATVARRSRTGDVPAPRAEPAAGPARVGTMKAP